LHVLAGTFGRVLECWDRKYKDYCAVKIVRNVDKYRHAAMIEVRGLNAALMTNTCSTITVLGTVAEAVCLKLVL
jgi:hypothetical protein